MCGGSVSGFSFGEVDVLEVNLSWNRGFMKISVIYSKMLEVLKSIHKTLIHILQNIKTFMTSFTQILGQGYLTHFKI